MSATEIRPQNTRASDRPRFLAMSPATRQDYAVAGVLAAATVLYAVALTPFGSRLAGPDTDLLSASYMGAIVAQATCSLLFWGQWRAGRHAPTGLLAIAFGFAACMLLVYWIEYPGTIGDAGLVPLALGSVGWLGAFWPCGIFVLVVLFALTSQREEPWDAAVKIAAAATAAIAIAAVVVLLTASRALPPLSESGRTTPLYTGVVAPFVVVAGAATLGLIAAVTRLRRWADVYVAMFVVGIVARSYCNCIGPQRYSYGWYASRTIVLAVSLGLVFAVIRQIGALYGQLARDNRRLADAALIDGLTRVANRRAFDAELAALAEPAAIAIIDIDYFKQLNDHVGHQAGDDCLRLIARTLAAQILRSEDLIARYGGDEFVAILRGTNLEDAVGVAERIRQAVRDLRVPYDDAGSCVTVSVGVASASAGEPAADLLARADAALYEAKNGGRDRVASG